MQCIVSVLFKYENITHMFILFYCSNTGTILGSSRGGFDIDKICEFIKSKKIKQLYVIGGDGVSL